jgi:hypothetical protein
MLKFFFLYLKFLLFYNFEVLKNFKYFFNFVRHDNNCDCFLSENFYYISNLLKEFNVIFENYLNM